MKRLLSLTSVLALALSLSACGKNSKKIVSDVDVKSQDIDQQKYVTADFEMSLGAAEFPFINLPLPKNYGSLELYRLNAVNRVRINVNLTEITKLPGGDATLPNGTMVPVDAMGAGIIEIPVDGINGKVYVAYSDDVALVGFAVSIKQLDGVGSSLGTIGVFPNFDIKNVNVTAGVYSSEDQGETGIAVFGNVAGLINGSTSIELAKETFKTREQYVPAWKERALGRRLLRVKSVKQTLELSEQK